MLHVQRSALLAGKMSSVCMVLPDKSRIRLERLNIRHSRCIVVPP
jgi:hypothetical protein